VTGSESHGLPRRRHLLGMDAERRRQGGRGDPVRRHGRPRHPQSVPGAVGARRRRVVMVRLDCGDVWEGWPSWYRKFAYRYRLFDRGTGNLPFSHFGTGFCLDGTVYAVGHRIVVSEPF